MANKKSNLLYILKVLEEHSDKKHPLTYEKIRQYVLNEYGSDIERKSIASSIQILMDQPYEYDIIKNESGGWYLDERLLDPTEITFLTNAVLTSKALPPNTASRLNAKLLSILSENYRKNFKAIKQCEDIDRSANKQLTYIIEVICHAIRHNKKIKFNYAYYNEEGAFVNRKDSQGADKIYTVSPHFIINSRGVCYILCIPKHELTKEFKDFTPFRLDYMCNISEIDERRDDVNTLTNYKKNDFNLTEYLNSHIYVFGSDDKSTIKIQILKPTEGIRYVKDWFGKNAKISKSNNKTIATITSDSNTFFFWIMQYSTHFILLEPKELVIKVRNAAKNILDNYKIEE